LELQEARAALAKNPTGAAERVEIHDVIRNKLGVGRMETIDAANVEKDAVALSGIGK
jgi:hypothetical protein